MLLKISVSPYDGICNIILMHIYTLVTKIPLFSADYPNLIKYLFFVTIT